MEETKMLTTQEVNDVLRVWDAVEFARNYNNAYFNSYITPDAINEQMQNINMNPVEATVDEIVKALNTPKSSEEILRGYANSLENQNMYYKRLLRYLGDLPAFNMTFDCVNITKPSEYNSNAFKKDLAIVDDFSNRFNAKEQFSMALRQMLRQGVFYSVFRDEGSNYVLQELPARFCKITGKFDYGLLFDFDFNWFISNYGVDINMYPKVMKKMYREVFDNISKKYNPAKRVDYRNTSFVYWHQCSPNDGFWAWKVSPEITTLIPYFAPLFPDIALQPVIRNLQNDKYFIEASKLIVGLLGFHDNKQSGTVSNQIKMTPDMIGRFLGVARKGIKKQIGLTALPVDDVKVVEFDVKERNMLTEYLENITDQSIASSAVLSNTEKLSVHQSKLASAIDNNFVKSMYPAFANFVEYYINKRTTKYKFKIAFHDFNTPDDMAQRKDLLETYISKGATNWELMARLNDKNVFEYKRQIMMENSMFGDIPSQFVQLNNFYTQTGGSTNNTKSSSSVISKTTTTTTGGRPKVENSENENTVAAQERGSNELTTE